MIIVAFSTIGTRLRASSGRRSGNELHVRSRMSARTSSASRVTQARRSSPHHVGHDGAALATVVRVGGQAANLFSQRRPLDASVTGLHQGGADGVALVTRVAQ